MRRLPTAVKTHASNPRMLARTRRPVTAPNLFRATCSMHIWDVFCKQFDERGPPTKSEMTKRPVTAKQHVGEYSSTTGHMKIVAVQAEGHYVRLGNCSQTEQDIGGYYLQQSIRGQPVNCFLFPPRTFIQPGASITVWSENCRPSSRSFTDYVWTGLQRIGSNPEYTTILCTTNGQAVAWYTPAQYSMVRTHQAWEAPERSALSKGDNKRVTQQDIIKQEPVTHSARSHSHSGRILTLQRKTDVIRVSQSPWTQSTSSIIHPDCHLKIPHSTQCTSPSQLLHSTLTIVQLSTVREPKILHQLRII